MASLLDSKPDDNGAISDTQQKERNAGGDSSAIKQDQDFIAMRREEQMRREQEQREKTIRFHSRNRVDELIQPILSLELIKQFYEDDPQGKQLEIVPTSFESHTEYMNSWMPLFLFETYNQMIS